jgi:hypothetical protein
MSYKIVRAAKNNIKKIVKVYNIVRASGTSGTGLPIGGLTDQLIKKTSDTVNYASEWFTLTKDFIGLGNVTDGAKGTGFNDLGAIPDNQEYDAAVSDYSSDITVNRTIELVGFTAFTQRMAARWVVSGGGSPTINLPIGWEVETGSPKDLSSMADGTYDSLFKSYDNGSNGKVQVREVDI